MSRPRFNEKELRKGHNVAFSPAVWDRTQSHCADAERSVASLINDLLESYLDQVDAKATRRISDQSNHGRSPTEESDC